MPPTNNPNGAATVANFATDNLPILHRDTTDPSVFAEAAWGHVFNHRRAVSTRVPRAVVHATSAAHVRQAVALAAHLGCRVSVRSGGHSWAGWSVRDDAVLVDLGGLPGGKHCELPGKAVDRVDGIVFDDVTGVVSCPPSATGRMLNGVLEGRGRLFAGGHCPDVGLGGFLLQGGMGWNCKNWGWACESIVGIDVVTADGKEAHCSSSENEDLFWAARGSGPGFPAVVTRFHLNTRPLGQMFQSVYIYPISEYRKVLQWVIDVCPTADPDTEIVAVGQYIPDFDEPVIIANFLAFKPNREEGEKALQSLHDSRPAGAKIEVFSELTSLSKQYAPQSASNPEGHRYCSENAYINNDEDVPAVLEKAFTTLPTRKTFALYFSMNPVSRKPSYNNIDNMALSMHTDHYFALYTIWEDAKDDEKCTNWVHGIMRDVEKHAEGAYLGDSDFQHRRTKFWRDEHAKKLMEVRRKWDPMGRICGYLDEGDKSGIKGLKNEFEWTAEA